MASDSISASCRPPRSESGTCADDQQARKALGALVDDYIKRHRRRLARELEYFSNANRSDEDAISRATLARLPGGKHPHQRRIPPASLEQSRILLLENLPRLRDTKSFDQLHNLVSELIKPVSKIGELAVYDTALRIGARLQIEPERVYLHAGTRKGARALGCDGNVPTIEMVDLPAPIARLTPREAEDFLCIYKNRFR